MFKGKRGLGESKEQLASSFLARHGVTVLERNFQILSGEVDLVCRDGAELVFVEVKFRSSNLFGTALEAVTPQKVRRLLRAAHVWLTKKHLLNSPWRIDVIAIDGDQIDWHKNFGS